MADPTNDPGLPAADEGGPAQLPAALRQDWPVPWQPVWGDKRGPWRDTLSLLTRGLMGVAVLLPHPLLRVMVGGFSRLLTRLLSERTRVAKDFLRQALGDLDERELHARVVQSWRHFLGVAIDTERFLRRVPEERILDHFEFEWSDDARRIRDEGLGVVVVTAHVGNWEAAALAAPWIGFDPFYAVAKPPRNRPFSKFVQRSRELRGIRLLPRKGAMRDAPRVIEAGGAVGLLLDQRARQKPVLAPFFGRPARCDRSAGVLMRRLKAPVLLTATYNTDRPLHFKTRFFGCLWPEELSDASPEEISARINRSIEEMILVDPDQYFWLHDRYKDTPAGPPDGDSEPAAGRLSPQGPSVVE
ncbi:MAG: hypothetical protein AAF682_25495 [Planctomycetota bacterium]